MTSSIRVYEGDYQGEQAVWLKAGRYEAAVLPQIGANLIALRDTEKQYRFLHEPAADEMEAFKANPVIHGIPVLFPPNRYEDGKFPWNGATYQFPVNEASTGNHLHGFVHYIPWALEGYGSDETECRVTLALKVDEAHPVYQYLPHEFTIRLRYTLSDQGLQQQVTIRNDGNTSMPCLLAFHTSINAPFAPNSETDDCRFTMTIGQRWELNERMLPTGNYQPLSGGEEAMKGSGVSPFFEPMDNHYTAAPQNGRNRMELTDTRHNVKLVYDVGTGFRQWMIWNQHKSGKFFCPEPQINLVNAPSVKLPADQIGLVALEPGAIWEETARLYVIEGRA